VPFINILVVEDEKLVAKDISNILKRLGHQVVDIVTTGQDALRKVEETGPDLVLIDIVLKGALDGIATAGLIQERFRIPVIYLTAYADEATLARAKITEPFGYILKPFDERDIKTAIEMMTYKARMDRTLRDREKWLATILRSIGDGVIAVDAAGRVTFMNTLAEVLTGRPLAEGAGQSIEGVVRISPELGTSSQSEALLTSGDGRQYTIESQTSPILDMSGQKAGYVFVFRDISQRQKTEYELQRSWEQIKKSLSGIVRAISQMTEMRDPYTAGHQRRVAQLSSAIAKEMGLHNDQVEGIRLAGEIHDIGKIHVPAEILSKPGRLTPVEFALIQTHAQAGYEILRSIEFPWPIAQIIWQHHERLDGSGYPNRVKGREILLEARILSVADVVEAMSSHRPYRPAPGVAKALEEIDHNKDKLYDSDVVEACTALFRAGRFAFDGPKLSSGDHSS
jgi:PAS domain S-box-containing protein/putative nucleotidyltransferase with HDIG domain